MKQYNRYSSILSLHWRYTHRIFIGILGVLAVTQVYFLYNQMSTASFTKEITDWSTESREVIISPWSLRLEEYMARSHMKTIFIIGFVLVLVLLVLISIWQRSNSHIEYTIMKLPVRENTWYVTSWLHSFLHLMILLSVQLGLVFVAYGMYLFMIPKEAQMTQPLVLSFLRWDFLQSLFPIFDQLKLVYLITVLVSISLLVVYLQNCMMKKITSVIIYLCGFAYKDFFEVMTKKEIYFNIFLMLLACVFMILLIKQFIVERKRL